MARGLLSKQRCIPLLVSILCVTGMILYLPSEAKGAVDQPRCETGPGAARPVDVYVPVDSWIYPALDRLRALG